MLFYLTTILNQSYQSCQYLLWPTGQTLLIQQCSLEEVTDMATDLELDLSMETVLVPDLPMGISPETEMEPEMAPSTSQERKRKYMSSRGALSTGGYT